MGRVSKNKSKVNKTLEVGWMDADRDTIAETKWLATRHLTLNVEIPKVSRGNCLN